MALYSYYVKAFCVCSAFFVVVCSSVDSLEGAGSGLAGLRQWFVPEELDGKILNGRDTRDVQHGVEEVGVWYKDLFDLKFEGGYSERGRVRQLAHFWYDWEVTLVETVAKVVAVFRLYTEQLLINSTRSYSKSIALNLKQLHVDGINITFPFGLDDLRVRLKCKKIFGQILEEELAVRSSRLRVPGGEGGVCFDWEVRVGEAYRGRIILVFFESSVPGQRLAWEAFDVALKKDWYGWYEYYVWVNDLKLYALNQGLYVDQVRHLFLAAGKEFHDGILPESPRDKV